MTQRAIFITGANGEVGHGLIRALANQSREMPIITLDLHKLDSALNEYVDESIVGDIMDSELINEVFNRYEIGTVYHLAALLSTHAERDPFRAHEVNVEGTVGLMRAAVGADDQSGEAVKFIFPSSIAVYGMPSIVEKRSAGAVCEGEYNQPQTMYGCNKLYIEHLGRYLTQHFRRGSDDRTTESLPSLDFRCVRFPGLISVQTLPTGGTSDYAPEMLHAAASGKTYAAFVRPDTTIPFMVMPDAVKALLNLSDAPVGNLHSRIYNVTGFSFSAQEISELIYERFPHSHITFQPDDGRQRIVDSWPADVDDSLARQEWEWSPEYDANRAFDDYLIPGVRSHYPQGER